MKNCIWPWFNDDFKAYCENNKDYRRIMSWKDSRLGSTYYFPDGSARHDVIIPRNQYNRVAKLLGLKDTVRASAKRQETSSQVLVPQQGQEQLASFTARSEAMVVREGVATGASKSTRKSPQKSDKRESLNLMKQCPRFNKCDVPICPLDPLQDERTYLPGEPKCKLPKARRQKIGKGSMLERQGLTKSELAARKRWESMTDSERKDVTKRLKGKASCSLI